MGFVKRYVEWVKKGGCRYKEGVLDERGEARWVRGDGRCVNRGE